MSGRLTRTFIPGFERDDMAVFDTVAGFFIELIKAHGRTPPKR